MDTELASSAHVPASEEPSEVPSPKRCLNCDTPVVGAYCSECGQEAKPSVVPLGDLFRDIWEEFFKWDNRLWGTLKALITRPGMLTEEYVQGRRARYISPFKLYFSISAIWFLLFSATGLQAELTRGITLGAKEGTRMGRSLKQSQTAPAGSTAPSTVSAAPSSPGKKPKLDEAKLGKAVGQWSEWYFANSNLLMFLMVPVLALLLMGLCRGSQRLYIEHLVFSVHITAFTFVASFLMFIPGAVGVGNLITFPAGLVYLALAMRRFYRLSWGQTLVKLVLSQLGYYCLYFLVTVVALLYFIVVNHSGRS